MGEKYGLGIEITSQARDEYQTEAYQKLGLPIAPAVVIGGHIITERSKMSEEKLEETICRELKL